MKKGAKWAIIAVSCCLLASMAKGCANSYEKTSAQSTNNQTTSSGYSNLIDEYEKTRDEVSDFFDTQENSNKLGR
jgi:hypothetical protein